VTDTGLEIYSQCLANVCTSGIRHTSATNLASKGEVLSFLQTKANGNGMLRSITARVATLSGQRQRAFPLTQTTPIPCDTKLRIRFVHCFLTMRGVSSMPELH
jgi:hypothetical protein